MTCDRGPMSVTGRGRSLRESEITRYTEMTFVFLLTQTHLVWRVFALEVSDMRTSHLDCQFITCPDKKFLLGSVRKQVVSSGGSGSSVQAALSLLRHLGDGCSLSTGPSPLRRSKKRGFAAGTIYEALAVAIVVGKLRNLTVKETTF